MVFKKLMLMKFFYLQKCYRGFVNISFHKIDVKLALLKSYFLVVVLCQWLAPQSSSTRLRSDTKPNSLNLHIYSYTPSTMQYVQMHYNFTLQYPTFIMLYLDTLEIQDMHSIFILTIILWLASRIQVSPMLYID